MWRRDPRPLLVYVLYTGNLYGTEKMALATLEGLGAYPTRVLIAPPPSETASVAVVARAAGYVTHAFTSRWQLLARLLPWFLRYRTIDVIGVSVDANVFCHVLGRLFGVRLRQLQVTHGGTEDAVAYGSKHKLNSIPVGIVAVSNFVQHKLLAHGVRADRISVIENFLSHSQRLEYRARTAYDGPDAGACRRLDPARVRVAVVSRVDPIKRIGLLVEAVETLGLAEFDFDVYGTGVELDTLRRRGAPLPNLRFHGYVGDVRDRLPEADLLLHLCPVEPFGLAILEAFVTRLVVVVPDAGGAGDLVDDGRTGLRFHADDMADLADTLHRARRLSADALQAMVEAAAIEMDGRYSQAEGIRRYRAALDAAGRIGQTAPPPA